ncbi:hypothetical protein MOSE0_K09054 [Monosporozyma servazzii]
MGRPKKEISEEKIENFQRELELAGNRTDILLKDKKGRSRSCLLCRRRKQRCDHKLPSCTACLKAGVKCIQPARYQSNAGSKTSSTNSILSDGTPNNSNSNTPLSSTRDLSESSVLSPSNEASPMGSNSSMLPLTTATSEKIVKPTHNSHKDEYTKLLEKKLRFLEILIDLPPNTITFKKKLKQYKKITHLLSNMNDKIDDFDDRSYSGDISGSTTPIGNNYNRNILLPPPPPQFFDSNRNVHDLNLDYKRSQSSQSPSSIASPIHKRKHDAITQLILKSFNNFDFNSCIFAKYNLQEFLSYKPAIEFDEDLSRSFLDTFFTRLQFKYPLLDEQEIYSFHEHFVNNDIYSYSETDFHFACGRMWLVYTISACLHMTTGKYKGSPPMCYFSTAIRHIAKCGKNLNYVQQIELLTLLVLYLLRTDKDSLVLYEIIKDIMSICIEKLYLNKWHSLDPFANKKLRLFWCVYLLERMICVAVGKPYTIQESEIDLPYFNEDSFMTKDNKIHKGVHFINQSVKLRRTESRFVEQLHIIPQRPDVVTNTLNNGNNKDMLIKQLPQVRKIFKDLEIWRSGVVTTSFKNFENETLKLYYYRAVRLLIQPYLEILTPDDRLFRECQAAAGQICQLYKIFHQKTITGHSTPAVHTVFVAGVTLIYCMWLARNFDDEKRRKLGDDSKHTRPLVNATLFSTMDDLRACSVCLYVMTERSNFARIFRDAFDQLMNATMGNLIERCGPNSSELIYMVNDIKKSKHNLSGHQSNSNSNKLNNDSAGNDAIPGYFDGKKSDHISNSSGNNHNKTESETSTSGMPPAMNRTFGKFQAEEHVGFVENSQVDLDEQMALNRKRGMLEKATVPKSLAHLLINVDVKEEEKSSPRDSPVSIKSPRDTVPALINSEKEDRSSRTSSNNDDSKRYIVKKPVNFNEFDWENFEHQAFLQQHLAQQNLQAYLTSLNYNKNDPTDNKKDTDIVVKQEHVGAAIMNGINSSPNIMNTYVPEKQATQQQLPQLLQPPLPVQTNVNRVLPPFPSQHQVKQHNQNISSGANLSNANVTTNPIKGNIPIQPPLPHYFQSSSVINNPGVATENYSMNQLNHGYLPLNNGNNTPSNNNINMNANTINPNNNVTGTKSNEVDPSGILFNNGTHDMINNISTWTNDSVTELLSHTGNSNINLNMMANSMPINNSSQVQDNNNTMINSNANNNAIAYNNNNSTVTDQPMGNVDPSHENTNNEVNTNVNNGDVLTVEPNNNGNNNKVPSPFIAKTRFTDNLAPVEDFWTVNDDYGFLT